LDACSLTGTAQPQDTTHVNNGNCDGTKNHLFQITHGTSCGGAAANDGTEKPWRKCIVNPTIYGRLQLSESPARTDLS